MKRKLSILHILLLTVTLASAPAQADIWDDLKKVPKKIEKEVKRTPGNLKKIPKKMEREVKKGLEKVGKAGEKVLEGVTQGAGKTVQTIGNVGEATGNLLTGDEESAKRALKRAERNAHDAAKNVGSAAETTGKMGYEATLGLSISGTALVVDTLLNNDGRLAKEYKKTRQRVSKEIRRGSKKVGAALEVTIQPENLTRIALVYCASSVAGPFGAALANVMYDKLILQKDMSDEDFIKSFAIGAAAGYAAEGVQGLSEMQSAYLSKAASNMTSNLATDLGNIALNDAGYSSKDFFESLATGMAVVETGDGILAETFESTVQGGLQNASTQLVEKDFTLEEVDFYQVEQAMYRGMADGLTTASVHAIMDATVIDSLPERIDEKAIEQFTALFSSTMQSIEERQTDEFIEDFEKLPQQDQEKVLKLANELGKEITDAVAQQVYNKSFNELVPEEITSEKFTALYKAAVRAHLVGTKQTDEIKQYFRDSNGLRREPAGLPALPIVFGALTLYELHTLYAKYEASEKPGQSFEEFVEQNKTDIVLFTTGILPAGKLAKVANKVAKAANANKVAKAAKKLAAAGGKGIEIKISEKIKKQAQKRGWTQDSIEEAINSPSTTKRTTDKRHLPSGGQNNEPATQYYTKDGHYVVRNDKTGDIVQVSDRNNPNWRDPNQL